jgi:hypothetical protein
MSIKNRVVLAPRQPRMMARPGIAGRQDFIPGAGTNFDLVGTSQTVVVCGTP